MFGQRRVLTYPEKHMERDGLSFLREHPEHLIGFKQPLSNGSPLIFFNHAHNSHNTGDLRIDLELGP